MLLAKYVPSDSLLHPFMQCLPTSLKSLSDHCFQSNLELGNSTTLQPRQDSHTRQCGLNEISASSDQSHNVMGWSVHSLQAEFKTYAKFLYKEGYSWFGCVLLCLVDRGSEFKGIVDILFKHYGIVIIISPPYHLAAGNGHSECSHQTLVNSILCACGKERHCWPLYIHTGFWEMRCLTSWVTRYTPYFILYGQHPFFAFDLTDRTRETLDWHTVTSTEDLLAMWMQQILCQDKKLVFAMEQQKPVHQWPVDDSTVSMNAICLPGTFF